MQTIDTDTTLKYTKGLSLLYVEDDLELQTQSKELFEILFDSVTVANDGVEALEIYNQKPFDVIITDVKMPNMDGVQLTKQIKEINPDQCIIIISAYNNTEYLIEFLNLNIKQFMQKPIETNNMLLTLHSVAKNIVNEKMVETYRKELEKRNAELKSKNEELQSLVRILDSKLAQIAQNTAKYDDSADFNEYRITTEDIDELKELEQDISGAAVLISLSKNLSVSNIHVLGDMFTTYTQILSRYDGYKELTTHIKLLGETLNNAPENFIKRVAEISILLESFIYVLRMWRGNLENEEFKKALELHASMINDISTIIAIVNGTVDEIETEMEFF